VNDRVRGVLLGLGVGIGPLLLLDLARILRDAVATDGGETSVWWPIACYLAAGLVAAAGIAAGRRDRIVPAIGALVVLLVALPTVPSAIAERVPSLPVVPATTPSQAIAFVLVGAYLYAAIQGPRG
jgi:hypothetical protein